jgi:N-acetyl-alpha-D-muramate 1-phosphate uridylyltransferase
MRAMVLAAGRGERMRPLTDTVPKPLLKVGGQALIVWHLKALARAGIVEVVINHAHLGALIEAELGDGAQFGLRLLYSCETQALETAGGIARALPLLDPAGDDAPFLVVNGDIFTDFDFNRCRSIAAQMRCNIDCWTVLVPNPEHHPTGDFELVGATLLDSTLSAQRWTFSGIGLYRASLFKNLGANQAAKLAPLIRAAIARDRAAGELHYGQWLDIGTPERLAQLDYDLKQAL